MQAVVLEGARQVNFGVSSSAAQSEPLPPGVYDCWCDVECWIAVGPNAATGLTSATGYRIPAGSVIPVQIVKSGARFGAVSGGAGTFAFHQTGD